MGEVPNVAIHAVRLVLRRNGNTMLLCIRDLSRTGIEIPLAPRGDDLEVRCECLHGQLEAYLIVALARRSVRDCIRTLTLGDIDECLCDHGTRKRCTEQILSLVDGSRLERRPNILLKELLREIDNVHLRCAGCQRLVMNGFQFLALPDVRTDGNDLTAVIVLFEPGNNNRGVKTSGVCKNYLFDLLCHT